ncbi:MAG: LysM peptidoglycan-binding domain-containing protein [Rhodanobacter sp.]
MDNKTSQPSFSPVPAGVPSIAPAAVADLGDVQPHVGATIDETTIYAVMAGDNLASIATHFYGNANAWKTIFDANRDQLTDPDRIMTGQMLKIPAKP